MKPDSWLEQGRAAGLLQPFLHRLLSPPVRAAQLWKSPAFATVRNVLPAGGAAACDPTWGRGNKGCESAPRTDFSPGEGQPQWELPAPATPRAARPRQSCLLLAGLSLAWIVLVPQQGGSACKGLFLCFSSEAGNRAFRGKVPARDRVCPSSYVSQIALNEEQRSWV